MPQPTPNEVRTKITTARERPGMAALRKRFADDEAYFPQNRKFEAGTGYSSFTSNRAHVTARKLISWLSEAKLVLMCDDGPGSARRASGTKLEKYIRGSLRYNNDRLVSSMSAPLQRQMAFYTVVRGWNAGRAMWNNYEPRKGQSVSVCEVEPWDPMHIAFGHDPRGLVWMGRVQRRTPAQIEAIYGKKVEASDETGEQCFEYLDRDVWAVSVKDEWLINPIEHEVTDPWGRNICPGYLGFQGPTPFLTPDDGQEDTLWQYVGDSWMESGRHLMEIQNKSMSDWMTLVRYAVKHPLIIRSKDGKFRLPEDPYQEGVNIHLKDGETIELAPEMKMVADAAAFVGISSGELQQAFLPDIVFGDMKMQISGHAANILRQGARHQVQFRLDHMAEQYKHIATLLRWQYQSGGYGVQTFMGNTGPLQQWYSEEIRPEELEQAGYLDVEFRHDLGFDDPAKFTTAQTLRAAGADGRPLAPDDFIWTEILDIEDPKAWDDAINTQLARAADPRIAALDMYESLLNRGQSVEAQLVLEKLKQVIMRDRRTAALEKMQFESTMGQLMQGGPGAPGQPLPQGERGTPLPQGEGRGEGRGEGAADALLGTNNADVPATETGLDLFRAGVPGDNARLPGEIRPGAREEMATGVRVRNGRGP